MSKTIKKDILVSLLIQVIGLTSLFLGWIISFPIGRIGVWVSFAVYIIALVIFFFLEKNEKKVHLVSIVTSLATGILIGSYISGFSKDIVMVLKAIGIVAGLVLFVHLLLVFIPYRKTIIVLALILLVPAIIVGFIYFKNILSKELTLLGINFLFTLIGLLIYLNVGKGIDLYLAGSLLWAFIVIFIIIIVILSEGEALSGLDAPVGSRKNKKK